MIKEIPNGVFPTMLTPFTDDNKVDYNGVEQLLEWYSKKGVDGIFAICQSSEIFYLSFEERLELLKFIMKNAPKDMSIVASGHVEDDMDTAVYQAQQFIDQGIDAYVFISNRLAKEDESDDVFLKNIVRAKGLTRASELISGIMMPTPSAVMAAVKLLSEGTDKQSGIGELIAIDVGGATTDIYSVSDGMPDDPRTLLKGLPEPYLKRTVEGDIGMRYSIHGIVESAGGIGKIASLAGLSEARAAELVERFASHTDLLPDSPETLALDEALACMAVRTAVTRHAGSIEETYSMLGTTYVQTGKNLTNIERIVITGGSLIHTEHTEHIASYALYDEKEPSSLKPKKASVLVDRKYIIAAMGLLGEHYPETALTIMKKELQ